jgi:hypothetical protein
MKSLKDLSQENVGNQEFAIVHLICQSIYNNLMTKFFQNTNYSK